MTTLSTRPIKHIGFDDPKGIKPDEHFFSNFNQEDDNSDIEYDADDVNNLSENEDEECTIETDFETASEISEAEIILPPKKSFKKDKIFKSYTVILQEEEFTPEIFSR